MDAVYRVARGQERHGRAANPDGMHRTSLVLTDRERTRGLSEERLALALRLLRDTGLVLIENAFTRGFIAQVRAAYDILVEAHVAAQGGWEGLDGKTFGQKHLGFFPPLHPPLSDPQIAAHPVAVQVLEAALGKDLQCSFYHTNTCFPGSDYQPVHRDQGHLFGTEMVGAHPVSHLVLNIPLCDFTEENGATEVWPGTHLVVDSDPRDAGKLDERASALPSVRMLAPAGSLVLRDLRTWHRGVPNRADHPRTMMAIVYQREWLYYKPITIPRSTWDAWPERARRIFRRNTVVEDESHRPITWEERGEK